MKHLKKFKLFESYYDTDDDITDLINDLEDRLDCELLKREYETSCLKFIFKSKTEDHTKVLEGLRWFIDSILKFDKIKIPPTRYVKVERIFTPTEGKTENQSGNRYFVLIKGHSDYLIDHLIADYKNDPEDVKEEISKFDKNEFIHELFKIYCNRTLFSFDFSMLEAFRSTDGELLEPILFDEVGLPYNLHEQFKIDITPIFLEKVYKNSGLVFRIGLSSRYQFDMVKKGDRLSKDSIDKETDRKLKELGLNLTWEDIFVKKNYRSYY